ncbi:MAG TPA: aldo/keto reductase [Spirochaetia bacterium]|nr:aldo/keto reductase [Spirochaetia bacterium]
MNKRRIGKTDVEVTPIGLGCWQFSQSSSWFSNFWETLNQRTIDEVVATALKGGIDWFDTAELYGRGTSEKGLAAALKTAGVKPGSVRIATKWWPVLRSARTIPANIETRIACLAPYPVDLYQVHQPWSVSPVPGQMREMAKLLLDHRIRAVGVSNFSARSMELAHATLASQGLVLASNQMRFNLLDRHIERNGVLAAAKRLGITIIAYSPLAQGVLTGRFHEDPSQVAKVSRMRRMMGTMSPLRLARTAPLLDELRSIARAHGVSIAQVALSWTVSFHGDTVVAIPGASRMAQAEQSAGALSVRLSPQELNRIDELSRKVSSR